MENATDTAPKRESTDGILAALGIPERDVVDAVRDGLTEGLRLDAAAPKIAPGFYAWTGTVASLRSSLASRGWTQADKQNLPTIMSPNGRVRLIVASGDSGTGQLASTPSTSNPKGRAVEEHVRSNTPGRGQQIQLAFDIDVDSNRKATGDCQTWILLYRRDVGQQASFAEVSLPLEIAGGKVTQWGERAIIEIPELFPAEAGRTTDVSAFDDVEFEIRASGEG